MAKGKMKQPMERHDRTERYDKPKTKELHLPTMKGPFSGKSIEARCHGKDIHRIGKNKRDSAYIFSWDAIKKWFEQDFKIAKKHNHDRIIAVTGEEGYGKSTLAILLALTVDNELSVDDIIFSRKKLSERLRNADPGDTIIVDEAGVSMFAQEWWDSMQKEVVKRLVVGRVKGLRIFFVTPHLDMLNKQIRERRVDQWVHTKKVGRYGRGEAQMAEPSKSKYYMNIFWKPLLSMKFPKFEGELWDKYQRKKLDFVDEVWDETDERAKKKIERFATIYRLTEEFDLTSTDIAKCLTVKATTVRDIQQKLRNNDDLREKVRQKSKEV